MTPGPYDDALTVVRAADLDDGDTLPRWLVDILWARSAVGVLGGAPKTCKSWLALDLAVSVATGTPCLDAFDVDHPGPVLLYMAEDAAPVVKARLAGLCRTRALDLASAPIHVITTPVLRLDRGRDQARLRAAVRQLAPRLLVLDPFVRLHRIDELCDAAHNSSHVTKPVMCRAEVDRGNAVGACDCWGRIGHITAAPRAATGARW